MDANELDAKIKLLLLKDTDKVREQIPQVWNNLEQATKGIELEGEKMAPKRRRVGLAIVAAAAALLLVFLFGTTSGQAAVKKVKDILLPEKQITQNLEGQKEETNVSLQESNKGYTIYIDQERYELTTKDGKDLITPKQKPGGNLPEIYMAIEVVKDKSPETLAGQIEAQLKEKYPEVKNQGKVTTPITSLLLTAKSGVKWDSIVERIYLVDNKKGGTIVVREHFFLEAEEGHGARFDNMLGELRLQQ